MVDDHIRHCAVINEINKTIVQLQNRSLFIIQ
jgi:hypothetical protein